MPPHRVEQLIRGITGWDFSLVELMLIGERRIAMMQEFNRRHGLTRADDTFPDRIFDEKIAEGPYAGCSISRTQWDEALRLFYAMHGFDEDGVPTEAKLHELELHWVVEQRAEAVAGVPATSPDQE